MSISTFPAFRPPTNTKESTQPTSSTSSGFPTHTTTAPPRSTLKHFKICLPNPFLILLATSPTLILGGPLAYGICQAGCAAVMTACYAAGGATWGATLGSNAPATIVACNSAFGTCQAACAVVALMHTL
ncbi:hypothetical protein BKA61DRAFT_738127 [Leptodontidium sp. MPI-SDFR-AT-0119]|nr:hypothetical protein BKA61DRAFT_738127 [Leptodontidium sp. MPI-SDFR-AT-0119]